MTIRQQVTAVTDYVSSLHAIHPGWRKLTPQGWSQGHAIKMEAMNEKWWQTQTNLLDSMTDNEGWCHSPPTSSSSNSSSADSSGDSSDGSDGSLRVKNDMSISFKSSKKKNNSSTQWTGCASICHNVECIIVWNKRESKTTRISDNCWKQNGKTCGANWIRHEKKNKTIDTKQWFLPQKDVVHLQLATWRILPRRSEQRNECVNVQSNDC